MQKPPHLLSMYKWLKTIYTSPAKTLRAFCVVFVTSVALTSLRNSLFDSRVLLSIFGGMFFCLSLAILFMNKKSVQFIFLILVAVLLGAWRFGVGQVAGSESVGKGIVGQVVEAPSAKLGYTEYVVKLDVSIILVLASKYPKYDYGDTVALDCKTKIPENIPGSTFNYKKYLESRGISLVCSYPKSFELISKGDFGFYNFILSVKEKLSTEVEKLWPEPGASLMAGLLYGAQSDLPKSIKDEFSISGLSHIIAVSGFNVSIIAMVLLLIFTRAGLRRHLAVILAFVAIWLFVIMVGASASAVRAGIMASVVLVAELLGRLPDVGGALIFVATLMALHNPYIILWDIGFQLSFVATLGIVYGTQIVEKMIRNREIGNREIPKKRNKNYFKIPDFIVEVFSTTMAAIIATLPIMLYYFGKLSPLSLIANILVVPFVPWLMLGGAIAIGLGFIFFPIGYAVAFVANVGLQYILLVVHLFGAPKLAINLALPWWGVVIFYSILIFYVVRQTKKISYEPSRDW